MAPAEIIPRFAANAASLTSGLFRRADKECVVEPGVNDCAKPQVMGPMVIGILAGIGGLLFFGVVGVLAYLHIRRTKRDKKESYKDHELDDYGLGHLPGRSPARSPERSPPPNYPRRGDSLPADAKENPFADEAGLKKEG